MTLLGQVMLDTSPAPFTLGTVATDIYGASVTFVYPGSAIQVEAELPWLKSSIASNTLAMYLTDAVSGVAQIGQPHQTPVTTSRNFTGRLLSPGLTALRDASGIWQPMVQGNEYTLKLQWLYVVSATMTVGWSAGSAFSGFVLARTL